MLTTAQAWFLIIFAIYGLLSAIWSFIKSFRQKAAYGLTPQFYPLGAFVWADAVVFGVFWFGYSLFTLWVQDWILFWLGVAFFWFIRSIGETIFWFGQQFSTIERYPAKDLPGYRWFHNDSIWFVYQIIAQCITVVSGLLSLYLGWLWIGTL